MINQLSLFALSITVFCFSINLKAQFTDSFTDGDFTNNPIWTGDTSSFQITPTFELQLNAPAVTATSHLVTPSVAIGNAQYDFYIRMDFDPSTSNYAKVYLTATDSNISGSLNGYFVQIGGASGTVDDVSLYHQSSTTKTKIIDGTDGTVAASPELNIRVTRDMSGNWELLIDTAMSGTYVSEGTVFHDQTTTSSYFGVFCKYTSTRSDKFYFDNFVVIGGLVVDVNPPIVDSIVVKSSTEIDVYFNEGVEQSTAEQTSNYLINSSIGSPISSTQNATNKAIVHLVFGTALTNNTSNILTVSNVKDIAGNVMLSQNIPFTTSFLQGANYGDVIINEIFSDPTPTQGLPDAEYIELVNNTNAPINLKNWVYGDASTKVLLPEITLQTNDHLILCDEDDTTLFTGFGKVLGLSSWPTLNNGGDNLGLRDATDHLIDTVAYTSAWYTDADKATGGWSLERKNPKSICSDASNWGVSTSSNGGTPGTQNSIFSTISIPFELISTAITSSSNMEMVFSQRVDPATVITNNFEVIPSSTVIGATVNNQNQNVVTLVVTPNLELGTIYQVIASNLTDCAGNGIQNDSTVFISLPQNQDLLINEILFNPRTGGSDFVELYNTSENAIDLKNWSLLYFNNAGDSAYKIISSTSRIIEVGEFVVLSEDSANNKFEYPNSADGTFLEMDLPTYSNAEGNVIVLNQLGDLNDNFQYNENMHLELITDPKGVSLERANYSLGKNSANNWHSASSTAGYATPGFENSQFIENEKASSTITLNPKTFSPNNDGYKDVLSIAYAFNQANYIATVTIHTTNGQLINTLVNNQTIGASGTVFWDGTNSNNEIMPTGMYVIMMRVFDLNNNQHVFKEVAVLAMP